MGLIWATIIFVFGLVGAIIIAVAGRLLSDDVKEWLPWITRHLIERAVSRLPETEREKRREEWKSDVNEWPGSLAKVYRAWGYLSAAKAIHRIAVSGATPQFANVALAATFLVFLSPLLCVLALCIKLESAGPAIFRQKRFGAHGRPFNALKFRTTAVETDVLLDQLTQSGENSRVTRVGRYIRLLSFDELPQLINVLRGEVPLVGPNKLAQLIRIIKGLPTRDTKPRTEDSIARREQPLRR